MRKFGILVVVFLTAATILPAKKLTGYEIMKTALNKGGWKTMSASVEMILTNASGKMRRRIIQMYTRKRTENESDMLMRFVYPADVKGTGFLLIERENADDLRYLYLPALRRIKRIASSGKGGNFMSSDFTYYDIGKPKLDDWKYKLLGTETVGGKACYKIECLPASEKIKEETGYGKIIRWIRKDIFLTVKSVYYDKGLAKWKILTVPDYSQIGGVWFQTDMVLRDIQNNHTSEMIFSDIKINNIIPSKFFTKRFLQRGAK